MTPTIIFICFIAYSLLLFAIAWFTSRRANNETYFLGNKSSPWYVIAYGMIGASLSGVTFMSVPGWVGQTQFTYFALVLGYLLGYYVIATVLMPVYYKLNLTSIYTYLQKRFGFWSYKTGAFYFLLSRTIGASFRMFLVINVLYVFVFQQWNIPFIAAALFFILLIMLYTFKGGIKTIIWTDTLQTTFMLASVIISIIIIAQHLGWDFGTLTEKVVHSGYSKIIESDWTSKHHFLKQFFSGAFIAIVMTGLDQDMMQKNLSCRNIKDAQKNMFTFSSILIIVNLLFLFLGAVLHLYTDVFNISKPTLSDDLFPTIALQYLGPVAAITFLIGLIAAAYSSADGALTALTTSFTIDFLNIKENTYWNDKMKKRIRYGIHLAFAAIMAITIILFKEINNQAIISKLFTIAGYTYGPLLGLYAFGFFIKRNIRDRFVPHVAIASPIICYVINENAALWFNGYKFGFELLIVNGLITFGGLYLLSINFPQNKIKA